MAKEETLVKVADTKEYAALKKAYADLKKEVDTRGLQPASATPVARKRPVQPAHGMLNPTSGASGRTSKVG